MSYDTIPLRLIWDEFKNQFKPLARFVVGFLFLGLALSFFIEPRYTSSAVLVKEVELGRGIASSAGGSGRGGSLGGLSQFISGGENELGLMGFSLKIADTRNFILQFINRHNLSPYLLAYDSMNKKTGEVNIDNDIYDVKNTKWLNKYKDHQIRDDDAVREFRKILSIVKNEEENFGAISITFYSSKLAYEWTSNFVFDLNNFMRNQEKEKARKNISFLEDKLSEIRQDTLRLQFSYLLESEISKLMSAEVQEEFAFQVIEPPFLSIKKSSGSRLYFIISFAFLGAFIYILAIFIPSLFKD